MNSLSADALLIELVENVPSLITAAWTGKSDSREPGKVLIPFFTEVFLHAAKSKSTVEMRFEKLTQFNSSTIAAVIQLINLAQKDGVPLTLVYDGTQRWQTLSFDALQRALKTFTLKDGWGVQFISLGKF